MESDVGSSGEDGIVTHGQCLTCALAGTSCCTADHPFVLAADVRRAQRALGASALRLFSVERVVSGSHRSAQFASLTASLYYDYSGDHYRLQMRSAGRWCVALRDSVGCILGDSRPLSCKLFPLLPVPDSGVHVSVPKATYNVSVECPLADNLEFRAGEIWLALGETLLQKEEEATYWQLGAREQSLLLQEAAAFKVAPDGLLTYLAARAQAY